jgi:hypothetical protein
MKKCPKCGTPLPENARFCVECGTRQRVPEREAPRPDALNFSGDLPAQLRERFFKALRVRIEEEHNAQQFQAYSERLYESGFRDAVQARTEQLSQELKRLWENDEIRQHEALALMQDVFDELLDFFIIHFCKDLNEVELSESILQYQGLKWEDVNLLQMILDYLDLFKEKETFYTDFLLMPVEKLKNAGQSFLFPDSKKEKILLICDQSLLGSCKEGFAFTEHALYWKAPLEKAREVRFDMLDELRRHKDWIIINGYFFSANKAINLRMLKLLKRIRLMQRKLF